MIIPDSSLLLYAYNTDAARHEPAKHWWNETLSGRETVGLAHPVLFAFVRVSTNPRAFPNPLALDTAADVIDRWRSRKVTRVLVPLARDVSRAIELLRAAASTRGDLVTDAQIAALAMEHKATVHTHDRDFSKFPGLKVRYPLDES